MPAQAPFNTPNIWNILEVTDTGYVPIFPLSPCWKPANVSVFMGFLSSAMLLIYHLNPTPLMAWYRFTPSTIYLLMNTSGRISSFTAPLHQQVKELSSMVGTIHPLPFS